MASNERPGKLGKPSAHGRWYGKWIVEEGGIGGMNYPCGLANSARPGDGITVPVDDIDDAEDESSSWGVLGTEPAL